MVGDVRHQGLDRTPKGHVYVPQAFGSVPCTLVARTNVPPLALADGARAAITGLDPEQPVSSVRTLEEVLRRANGRRRLTLCVLGCFAAGAVLPASIGLYGVMAYSIGRRTRRCGGGMLGPCPTGDEGQSCRALRHD